MRFVFEPNAPVGNEFQKVWNQPCESENCPACEHRLYHFNTGDELHIWVDRVIMRMLADDFSEFSKLEVVIHSDYPLDMLDTDLATHLFIKRWL